MSDVWDYTLIDIEKTDLLGALGDAGWEAVGIGDGKILLKRRHALVGAAYGNPGHRPPLVEQATQAPGELR